MKSWLADGLMELEVVEVSLSVVFRGKKRIVEGFNSASAASVEPDVIARAHLTKYPSPNNGKAHPDARGCVALALKHRLCTAWTE